LQVIEGHIADINIKDGLKNDRLVRAIKIKILSQKPTTQTRRLTRYWL